MYIYVYIYYIYFYIYIYITDIFLHVIPVGIIVLW